MSLWKRSLVALALILSLEAGMAFVPPETTRRGVPASATSTALALFEMFNQGKKMLVKQLAGDYDEAAIQARLDSLVVENPVLMLSFTT